MYIDKDILSNTISSVIHETLVNMHKKNVGEMSIEDINKLKSITTKCIYERLKDLPVKDTFILNSIVSKTDELKVFSNLLMETVSDIINKESEI